MKRRRNDLLRAEAQPRRSSITVSSTADRILQQALAHHQGGQLSQAESLYRQVLQIAPEQTEALRLLGVIAYQAGDHAKAVELFDKAILIRPNIAQSYCDRGNALLGLQQNETAVDSYDKAILLKPDFAEAYSNRGVALFGLGQYQADLENCDQAILLKPEFAEAHGNRGAALLGLEQYHAALESLDRAILLKPDITEAYGNRGSALLHLHLYQAALESCDKAIFLRPNFADAHNNRGGALQGLKHLEAAVESYDKAILLKPDFASAYSNRGNALYGLKRYPAALENYEKAIALKPDCEYLLGMRLHTKRSICDWEDSESQRLHLEACVGRNERVAHPFTMLAVTSSPALQRKAAETFAHDRYPTCSSHTAISNWAKKERIRIGYFSADFHDHAVSRLMAGVFECHDRSRYELLAFSFGQDEHDEVRTRISAAMDQFLDVRSLPDREVVQLSRKMEVDIALDLMGFTENSRTGIFAQRAAPIQVSYLGFPGTMGVDYIDYLIADDTLVPEQSRRQYSEKIIYMPGSFQANDSKYSTSMRLFTRAGEGLPENGFVYCCFNNNYKITPTVFDRWMRILGRVEGSVLWLLDGNPWAGENLRKEAARRGISSERLIFAPRLPLSEHMLRQRLADLFLDTLPFNAGATASPALWGGLPVLTRLGETFAGRMAASLLRAIGLPELVTDTDEDYEALAVELALDEQRYGALREKLDRNRLSAPLFDIPRFTRSLEAAYNAIYERNRMALSPEHIHVAKPPSQAAS